jgi:hypothetical protein
MSLRIIITSCAELFVKGVDTSVSEDASTVYASSTEPEALVPASVPTDASVPASPDALPTPDNVQNDTIR